MVDKVTPTDALVLTRRNRAIGVEVSLCFMPGEDPSCRWQTECSHGNCVGHVTKKIALGFLAVPWEWCEECSELFEAKEKAAREASK